MSNSIVNVNGIYYSITNPRDTIQKYLLYGIPWNQNMLLFLQDIILLRNLKHFVNIGAHIGTITIPISNVIPKVSACEPYFKTYIHLVENIKLNNITNIQTYNIALGDKYEKVYFMEDTIDRIVNNSGGMHVFTETDILENRRSAVNVNKTIHCNMYPLDTFAEIDDFDIIYIDIEGMEDVFLEGAKEKIKKNKPVIIIEIWDNTKRLLENMNTTTEDIVLTIIGFGYRFYRNIDADYIFLPL